MGLWIFGDGNHGTAHWQPDPANARGTWSILSTCIITLALWVYTSLHLNFLAFITILTNISRFKNTKYVIFGLLAPIPRRSLVDHIVPRPFNCLWIFERWSSCYTKELDFRTSRPGYPYKQLGHTRGPRLGER